MNTYAIPLEAEDMPSAWYNIAPDLPTPLAPPLHPATREPVTPQDMDAMFPPNLVEQEMSRERWISIPGPVMDAYRLYRPTPLRRALRLEQALQTPAKIFYKNESVSPSGSHKLNTAIAQVHYNAESGVRELTTETGAGQWGTALSIACGMFGLQCTIYMVRVSFDQKPYRRILMETYGGKVIASPSATTEFGRAYQAEHPESTGSLGIAISEAIEVAAHSGGRIRYALGSVLNHVMLHQTIIGEEARRQMDRAGAYPDVIIGCCGGGSNFAGLAFPYMRDVLSGKTKIDVAAVEPAACPTLSKGVYAYDFGDTGKMTPLLLQYTLGHDFVPPGIHAGGLRYHGVAQEVAHLVHSGHIRAIAAAQTPVFEAGLLFARSEGIVPAPESCHAIKAAVDAAVAARESGEAKTILFCLSGHGHFDMSAYDAFLKGDLQDPVLDEAAIRAAEAAIPPAPLP